MSATRSQTATLSRRTLGAALGLVLVVAAAPFLRSASAAQPTGDATAVAETAAVSATTVKTSDPAVWFNPVDATKSMVLGANNEDGLVVYDTTGAKQTQAGITKVLTTGVDTRNNVTLAAPNTSLAVSVGDGSVHYYSINVTTGKFTELAATAAATTPVWHSGKIDSVCLYQSPVSHNTYAFMMSNNGEMEQLQLSDNAGKVDVTAVRGYKPPSTGFWDITSVAGHRPGGCVVDDELKTLYVSDTALSTTTDKTGLGIWKFGAEPGDPTTGRLIATPTGGTGPQPTLSTKTLGLALVKTGPGAGYLLASSPDAVGGPLADSFMVYDRAEGNTYIRSFHVIAGTLDNCQQSDGIDAAVGNLGPNFTAGMFVCQDQHNQNSGAPAGFQNYKMVPIDQIVDMAGPAVTTTTIPVPTTQPAPVQVPNRSGYWMVGADGRVYNFGDAKSYGDAVLATGAQAVDLEPTPSGNGYWIVDNFGRVSGLGDATSFGDVDRSLLKGGEFVTSISATPTGKGYWVFTTAGRVIAFGDAVWYGDMSQVKLNGPVLDSIPSATGKGYYMVASDGGIFTFGDAVFKGSMGDKPLNKPVQSLVPDADGSGYWLVASDGGIFAFDAPFQGSMGAVKLNRPITGMVRFGNGYLMVGEDGGIFSFSDKKFFGSLGDHPPANPISSVAVLDAP